MIIVCVHNWLPEKVLLVIHFNHNECKTVSVDDSLLFPPFGFYWPVWSRHFFRKMFQFVRLNNVRPTFEHICIVKPLNSKVQRAEFSFHLLKGSSMYSIIGSFHYCILLLYYNFYHIRYSIATSYWLYQTIAQDAKIEKQLISWT